MKKWLGLFLLVIAALNLEAQNSVTPVVDSLKYGRVTITKDQRIELFGEKMHAYNVGLVKNIRSGKGYRLMLLSTNDRIVAMNLRSRLLQQYPDHKVYMTYQTPFIKLKMGNFVDKADAEKLKKQLLQQRIITGNIYVLSETIEVKPEIEEEQE